MANVRLLRQSLYDYDDKIKKINRDYASDYATYRKGVEAYNAEVAATPTVKDVYGMSTVITSDGREISIPMFGQVPTVGQYVMGEGTEGVTYANTIGKSAPDAPTMPDAPKQPNLTVRESEAVKYPGTDAAGIAMANAKGYTGKSDVEGMNDTGFRVTAQQNPFADPNDPNNLKERGILARTLGGQLG